MDDNDALARLPPAYAEALRLETSGVDPAGIAEALHLPVEAVIPLLRLGKAKLVSLLEGRG